MTDLGISTIDAEQLDAVLQQTASLIIGPDQTLGPQLFEDCNRHIANVFSSVQRGTLWDTAEEVIAAGVEPAQIRQSVRDFLTSQQATPTLQAIASIRWSCVLSLALDNSFERAFDRWLMRNPARGVAATIDQPSEVPPPRSTPIYKLLGSLNNDQFALTANDLLLWEAKWPAFVAQARDYIRGGTTVCVGMGSLSPFLLRLLATFLVDSRTSLSRVLLLKDDPIARESRIANLAQRGLRISVASTTVGGLRDARRGVQEHGGTSRLDYGVGKTTPYSALEEFDELVLMVNSRMKPTAASQERRQLLDLLFAPTSLRWDPFCHDLDFQRSITKEIHETVIEGSDRTQAGLHVVSVVSPSACGKTTILKRLAFDLVNDGFPVAWFRPYFYQDGPSEVQRFFQKVKDSSIYGDKAIIVVVDDPVGLGTTRLHDIRAAIEYSRLPAVLVVAVRLAELETLDADLSMGASAQLLRIDVPAEFDPDEHSRLPQYLVDLQIAKTAEAADAMVKEAASRDAADIMSTLYWLLPETRRSFAESVRDEYLRLGDRAALSEVIIGEINHTSGIVKSAYGLVACAEKYGAAVPLEVLVASLGVGYDEWLAAGAHNDLAWGVLYQEYSEESATILYRTRNAVVRDIIVKEVNGGILSHAGEVDRLHTLLRSCSGTSPVYREFCLRVLVPLIPKRLNELTFEEGDSLFEVAIAALPHRDPTLLHQWGNWQRRHGGKYLRTKETLMEALRARPYPYSVRQEAPEHIYTTLAANTRDAIRAGELSPDDGTREAMSFLDRAKSARFINAQATHVQASVIADLADLRGSQLDADFFGLLEKALGDLDRMLLMLTSDYANSPQAKKDVLMLERKRDDLLDRVLADPELEAHAEDLWIRHKRIDAFVLIARRRLRAARRSGKGSDFLSVWEFCKSLRKRSEEAGQQLPRALAEVMLHTLFLWQVRRRVLSAANDPIDWNTMRMLALVVLNDPGYSGDPYYLYLAALADAHLGDWESANREFAALRVAGLPAHVLWEPRDHLMNPEGGMRRVEGRMASGFGGKRFLNIPDLQTDMPASRSDRWPEDGQIAHAYVQFKFGGPEAVREP